MIEISEENAKFGEPQAYIDEFVRLASSQRGRTDFQVVTYNTLPELLDRFPEWFSLSVGKSSRKNTKDSQELIGRAWDRNVQIELVSLQNSKGEIEGGSVIFGFRQRYSQMGIFNPTASIVRGLYVDPKLRGSRAELQLLLETWSVSTARDFAYWVVRTPSTLDSMSIGLWNLYSKTGAKALGLNKELVNLDLNEDFSKLQGHLLVYAKASLEESISGSVVRDVLYEINSTFLNRSLENEELFRLYPLRKLYASEIPHKKYFDKAVPSYLLADVR